MTMEDCPKCGGKMTVKTKYEGVVKSRLFSLLFIAIGISLTVTAVGAILGIPMILYALFNGPKKRKFKVCTNCGYGWELH